MFHLRHLLPFAVLAAVLGIAAPGHAQTIIDEWSSIKTPPAPELKPVTVDPATTALLMLDFVKQTCNDQARPRCLATLPAAKKLLAAARAKNVLVVYSVVGGGTIADTLPDVAPTGKEPYVQAGPDKYLNTDLEKILKDHGIKTVIVTGTDSAGAVIHTADESAFRGLSVIVPVDATSAANAFAEQYVAYHLTYAPRVGNATTLTRVDMIKF
ncbi:MAG TPA: isochorismatase family protein [Stellaceae bacterium]|jgi:nicotinamidase-related amidase|nr:isochorismatase family protein [Stellaceae bacterium]